MKVLYFILALTLVNFVNSEADTKLRPNLLDESVDNYVTLVLINFSEVMRTGDPVLGIPVLDPLHINYVELKDFQFNTLHLDANASNVLLANYSYYIPTYVHVEFSNLTLFMTLAIAEIDVNGTYWCDGMWKYVFPIFGDGPFTIQILGTNNTSVGEVYLLDNKYLQIAYLNMSIVFDELRINFENILGGGDFGDQVNEMLSQLGKLYFDALFPYISSKVIPPMIQYINYALMEHSIWEIIGGALPGPPFIEK